MEYLINNSDPPLAPDLASEAERVIKMVFTDRPNGIYVVIVPSREVGQVSASTTSRESDELKEWVALNKRHIEMLVDILIKSRYDRTMFQRFSWCLTLARDVGLPIVCSYQLLGNYWMTTYAMPGGTFQTVWETAQE